MSRVAARHQNDLVAKKCFPTAGTEPDMRIGFRGITKILVNRGSLCGRGITSTIVGWSFPRHNSLFFAGKYGGTCHEDSKTQSRTKATRSVSFVALSALVSLWRKVFSADR
jgi:hypothetical protein